MDIELFDFLKTSSIIGCRTNRISCCSHSISFCTTNHYILISLKLVVVGLHLLDYGFIPVMCWDFNKYMERVNFFDVHSLLNSKLFS